MFTCLNCRHEWKKEENKEAFAVHLVNSVFEKIHPYLKREAELQGIKPPEFATAYRIERTLEERKRLGIVGVVGAVTNMEKDEIVVSVEKVKEWLAKYKDNILGVKKLIVHLYFHELKHYKINKRMMREGKYVEHKARYLRDLAYRSKIENQVSEYARKWTVKLEDIL